MKNREIKFRAWDEQKKIMHNDFQFIKTGDNGNDWILFTSDKQPITDYEGWSKNPYFSQQLKIMQYTGLKDKEGKEIYDGDILAIINNSVEFKTKGGGRISTHCYDGVFDISNEDLFVKRGHSLQCSKEEMEESKEDINSIIDFSTRKERIETWDKFVVELKPMSKNEGYDYNVTYFGIMSELHPPYTFHTKPEDYKIIGNIYSNPELVKQ